MKYCVHGLGFMAECGADATDRREGWPLCAEHARLWDELEHLAAITPEDDFDWVELAKEVR